MKSAEVFWSSNQGVNAERPQRVAVIGAGLAGLACADKLTSAGHVVDVFEARSRVGGRVFSQRRPASGATAEAGGEFIGKNHHSWQAFAQEFQLSLAPADEVGDSRWFFQGSPVRGAQADEARRSVQDVHCRMTALAGSIDSTAPWQGANALMWDQMSVRQWLDRQELRRPAQLHALTADVEGLNGVAADKQSMLGHLSQIQGGGLEAYWTDSQNERCIGGNDQLASALLRRIGADRVHLSHRVKELTTAFRSRGPELRLANDSVWRGDAIVLTAPPTCWHAIKFTSGMPLGRLPQMSRTVKQVTYLPADAQAAQLDSHHSNELGIAFEMWPVAMSAQPAHAVVTFVPLRQRVALESLPTTTEAALRQLNCQASTGFAHHVFDWAAEPFTEGGYAFPAPQEMTQLGARLYTKADGLLFAGDWAQYTHSGYMEGALRSGLRAAGLIIDAASAP